MSNWDNNNLPENHVFISDVKFVAVTEGTWKRKNKDGEQEIAPKWDYVTGAKEEQESLSVGVYSTTDKEEIELNKNYDLILKKAIGKDGTFYGYSLKGFGTSGEPIPKKEPQSRFQKSLKMSNKAEALKAASNIVTRSKTPSPDEVIEIAQIFEAWLNGEYEPTAKTEE